MHRPLAHAAVLVSLLAALAGGCGGGADSVLSETADKLGEIKSGNLTVALRAEGGGSEVGFDLAGPFQLAEPGRLPVAHLEYTQIAGSERATVTLISTGEKAFVETDGQTFVLPDAQAEKLRAVGEAPEGGGASSEGLGSLDIQDWLVDPTSSDGGSVGGAETDRVSADLDVVAAANDLLALFAAFRGGTVRRIEGNDTDRVRRAVKDARIDVWSGKDDRLLRRLVLELRLRADVPERIGDLLGPLGQAQLRFELAIADPNEPVSVEAPPNAEPLPSGSGL